MNDAQSEQAALTSAPEPTVPPGKPNIGQLLIGVLALLMSAGGFGVIVLVDMPEGKLAVVTGLLGIVFGWATAVVQWHFGSSAGSAAKDAAVTRLGGLIGR